MEHHLAKFLVSAELIRDALALPENANIVNIYQDDSPATYVFVIEHPDAPICNPGERVKVIKPMFHADYEKKPSMWIKCDLYATDPK